MIAAAVLVPGAVAACLYAYDVCAHSWDSDSVSAPPRAPQAVQCFCYCLVLVLLAASLGHCGQSVVARAEPTALF